MSLRNRLARLTTATPMFAPEPVRPPPAVPPPAPSSGSLLDDLRRRMDAILTRTRSEPARELPAVDQPELPFCVERTEHGPLHVRTLRLSGAHRVGRIPITGARRASSELLALLALDPRLAACDLGG